MSTCSTCGIRTEEHWVVCQSCGASLTLEEAEPLVGDVAVTDTSPQIELISRGWDDVIDTVEAPADPLVDGEISPGPLPPDAIEVAVDDITVIDAPEAEETEEGDETAETAVEDETADAESALPADPWDHLRPKGELPPLQHHVTVAGRIGQVMALLVGLSALISSGIHFYLNTRLDAFSEGRVSAATVDSVEAISDISLLVVAGFIVLAAGALGWWLVKSRGNRDLRPGKAGLLALGAFLAGVGVTATSIAIRKETVAEAIAANSLIVLGLGLLIAASLATVRTVERIDRREPA